MATNFVRGSISAINTGINYVPMGSWTLNRVQDVYNKVKDTSPSVVAKSLDKVESAVQQFIANPEETTLEEADLTANERLRSLNLPENLTDEQLELLNQFLASMSKEKDKQDEKQGNPSAVNNKQEMDTNSKKMVKVSSSKIEHLKQETSNWENPEETEKTQSLTLKQLEWSKEMLRWATVGFFAVHTGFQQIVSEMEKENEQSSRLNPKKPYYQKLTTVMTRCTLDWLTKSDFLDIMMKIFNTMSLTGDLMKSYISFGRRMVICCIQKLESANPTPQALKESRPKSL